jgi:hypothetical protein
VKVTGPDGDNPITDAQIRELRAVHLDPSPLWRREYAIALGEQRTVNDPEGDMRTARARCAAAWNARQGGAG